MKQQGFKLCNLTESEKWKIAWGVGIFGDWFPDSESLDNRKYAKQLFHARTAIEYYGSAVRDNSFSELVSLGRDINLGRIE